MENIFQSSAESGEIHLELDDRPLPERVRPCEFNHVFGQEHVWSSNTPLRRMVENDNFSALLFWGPPGTGKTTLAHLIGRYSQRNLISISAVHATVKEMRQIINDSIETQHKTGKSNILFVDEIHRLSKNQQDVLLPGMEAGHLRFIGATTENPSFSVNNAILSRCLTFSLKSLSREAICDVIARALASGDSALMGVTMTQKASAMLASAARGDARQALNLLAAVVAASSRSSDGTLTITPDTLQELGTVIPMRYDRDGEQHYDVISAFIKSIRASHPDAAVYYLARMIESGEDPVFIARRLLISASEDIGNANPTALLIAESTFRAVEVLGLPEARIPLSQCTTYLASSPKSNRAYNAINEALAEVKNTGPLDIPLHLRNAPTNFMKNIGYGRGYAYAHDDLDGARKLNYLPEKLRGKKFYHPVSIGTEKQIIETLKHLRPTQD